MAGDWIKMRIGLANDPAVIAIAAGLDIGEFEVVGMLHHLWSWADAQSRNGHASGVTRKWVNRFVHRDGFIEEMEKTGWIVVDESGITFPNFDRHNGESSKNRALAAERKRKQRINVTQEVPEMSRSERDKSVTREEKRREENKDQDLLSPDKPDDQPKKSKITYSEIQKAYNETCGHVLPKCIAMTEKRKTKVRSMGAMDVGGQKPFRDMGIEFWIAYFNDALLDPFKTGTNDRGWKADFDFLTNPNNALKILEKTDGT